MADNLFPSDLAKAFTYDPPDKAQRLKSRIAYLEAENDEQRQKIRAEYPQYSEYFDTLDESLKNKPKGYKYKPIEKKLPGY